VAEAAWKGLDRETVEPWLEGRMLDHGAHDLGGAVIDGAGLRCVGWHAWTGDPATSIPLFVFDEWPGLVPERAVSVP
jgi:hypothetical protein